MSFEIIKNYSDTVNNSLGIETLKAQVASHADIIADAATFEGCAAFDNGNPAESTITLRFSSEPGQAAKDAVDSLVSSHDGTQTPIGRFVVGSKIVEDSKVVGQAGTWQDIGGACTDVEFWANTDLPYVAGQLNGQINTDGSDAEIQLVHDDGVTQTVIGQFTCPDTGGAWQLFQFFTAAPPSGGLALYQVQARKNTTANFSVRYSTLSMFIIKP